jgi:hypothetical protein
MLGQEEESLNNLLKFAALRRRDEEQSSAGKGRVTNLAKLNCLTAPLLSS